MTQEKKQLLLIDISARLPYGVVCKISYTFNNETTNWEDVESTCDDIITKIDFDTKRVFSDWLSEYSSIDDVKPYLRPMSSMTEEEEKEFNHVFELELAALEEPAVGHTIKSAASNAFVIDFYNRHHFDFRGLIPMGLALEAKEGMYKF